MRHAPVGQGRVGEGIKRAVDLGIDFGLRRAGYQMGVDLGPGQDLAADDIASHKRVRGLQPNCPNPAASGIGSKAGVQKGDAVVDHCRHRHARIKVALRRPQVLARLRGAMFGHCQRRPNLDHPPEGWQANQHRTRADGHEAHLVRPAAATGRCMLGREEIALMAAIADVRQGERCFDRLRKAHPIRRLQYGEDRQVVVAEPGGQDDGAFSGDVTALIKPFRDALPFCHPSALDRCRTRTAWHSRFRCSLGPHPHSADFTGKQRADWAWRADGRGRPVSRASPRRSRNCTQDRGPTGPSAS